MSIPLYRGEEMVVFSLPPNWETANPVLSVREETSVLEALDQSEERWQRFPRPLYGIRFEATAVDSRQQGALRKLFETAEAKPFGMPLWTEAVELASDAAEGANSLSVTSMDGTLFSALSYLMLWADVDNWEVLKYGDVTFEDSIPLTQVTTRAWPAGTKLIPMAWGYCKRPDFQALGSDNSRIPIEFEERILFGSTREYEYWPTIVTTVEYTPCYDEIAVSWGSLPATVLNVEISHSASSDGPWLWWGETRQRTSGVTLSNYFKGRWVRVRALTLDGATTLKTFQPESPAVDPPTVEVFQRDWGADKSTRVPCGVGNIPEGYTGERTASTFGAGWELPYGGGYSGVDNYILGEIAEDAARDRIAAVYPGNLTDPASGLEKYRVSLFSDAFVELGWRYMPDTTWERGQFFGKSVDVVLSSEQDGVEMKWTLDGTDPTESSGYASDSAVFPWPDPYLRADFRPYVIARCFKDGCKSPPVYVPIEVTYHSDAICNPRQGHGGVRHSCPTYFRIGVEGECVRFPETCGDDYIPCDESAGPCHADLDGIRDEAIAEAISGSWGMYPTRTLRSWAGESSPRWTCSALEFETCWGVDTGLCDGSYWGGGSWRMDVDMYCADVYREDTFGWSYDSDSFGAGVPSDAFYLLSAKITITTESGPAQLIIPTAPDPPRNAVSGMTSGADDLAERLKSTFSLWYPDAYVMPSEFQTDTLDDVRVTISCAAS